MWARETHTFFFPIAHTWRRLSLRIGNSIHLSGSASLESFWNKLSSFLLLGKMGWARESIEVLGCSPMAIQGPLLVDQIHAKAVNRGPKGYSERRVYDCLGLMGSHMQV